MSKKLTERQLACLRELKPDLSNFAIVTHFLPLSECHELRDLLMVEKALVAKAESLATKTVEMDRYRNERNLMLYPFCSTAKAKRFTSIKYKSADGRRWLEVCASAEYGMAKIWDFDVLRFAFSKAGRISRIDDSTFPSFVDFTAYECLKALGRIPKCGSYKWLEEALTRLASTTYRGNIFREMRNTSLFLR